mgnify:CR=1 FL=1
MKKITNWIFLAAALYGGAIAQAQVQTVQVQVNSPSNDAEEDLTNNSLDLNSSDLELSTDGTDQMVGIRFESLNIPKGKIVALVGTSGAGKSTFIDLLPRFYDPIDGRITIDGIDIKALTIGSLRGLMSVVSQDAILFNDSIFNNIVFGLENVTEAQVIEAAKVANAHDFIQETEFGYQTNIGDRGMKLSGGQRQRLTIARAILRNPPILILDEATSALDTGTERDIQSALRQVSQNRTTLVIAHRLSTVVEADEILVLNEGEIVERGTHGQLLALKGRYADMWQSQQDEEEALRAHGPVAPAPEPATERDVAPDGARA